MSGTIVHRSYVRHDHAALLTIVLVACTLLIATLVVWTVSRPERGAVRITTSQTTPALAAGPAAVPASGGLGSRHAGRRLHLRGGLHLAEDATLDPVTTAGLIATAEHASRKAGG